MNLLNYYIKQQQNVEPHGVSVSSSRDITPMTDLLMKNFNIKNFNNNQEIVNNITMADRDPNIKISMASPLYLELEQKWPNTVIGKYVQDVLWEWLKYSYLPNDTSNISVIKNSIIYSLVDNSKGGENKTLKINNLNELSTTDIAKQLSSSFGQEYIENLNEDMKNDFNSIVNLLGAIGYLYTNGIYDQTTCGRFIYLLYKFLVSTDGFIEETRVVKTLSSIAARDINNANEANKKLNKFDNSGYNLQDENINNMYTLNALPLKTVSGINDIIQFIKKASLSEIQGFNNPNMLNTFNQLLDYILYQILPSNIIEDIEQIMNNRPSKYNITELKGIHLNSLIIKDFINFNAFNGSSMVTSLIISYFLIITSIHKNPMTLTQVVDVTGDLNLILTNIGLNPINNKVCIGKLNITDIIRLDINYKNNGAYTETYGILNNDSSLSDPLVKSFFSFSDKISSRAVYNHLASTYQNSYSKFESMVNLEMIETYFTLNNLNQFCTTSNPNNNNLKSFLNNYMNYLIADFKRAASGQQI